MLRVLDLKLILIPQTEDLLPTETFPRRKTLRRIYNTVAEADDRPLRSFTLESPIPSIPHSRASSDHSRGASPERQPRTFQLHQVAWDDENNRPLEPIKLDTPSTHKSPGLLKVMQKPFRRKKEEVRNETHFIPLSPFMTIFRTNPCSGTLHRLSLSHHWRRSADCGVEGKIDHMWKEISQIEDIMLFFSFFLQRFRYVERKRFLVWTKLIVNTLFLYTVL